MSEQNTRRYAPPEGYYDRTIKRPLSDFLAKALTMHNDATSMTALDFGCGAGSQTRYLLEKGYQVTAVDGNSEAAEYIRRLPHQNKVTFVQSSFETFEFKSYDLINSLHALSFTHKALFNDTFERLKKSIKPSGIFAGQFYGINDEWNKSGETMTFFNRAQVEELLSDMEVVSLVEKDEEGTIANNSPKHWHVFNAVAIQPSK